MAAGGLLRRLAGAENSGAAPPVRNSGSVGLSCVARSSDRSQCSRSPVCIPAEPIASKAIRFASRPVSGRFRARGLRTIGLPRGAFRSCSDAPYRPADRPVHGIVNPLGPEFSPPGELPSSSQGFPGLCGCRVHRWIRRRPWLCGRHRNDHSTLRDAGIGSGPPYSIGDLHRSVSTIRLSLVGDYVMADVRLDRCRDGLGVFRSASNGRRAAVEPALRGLRADGCVGFQMLQPAPARLSRWTDTPKDARVFVQRLSPSVPRSVAR